MKKVNKILIACLFAISVMFITTKVNAATASISATKSTASVGDNVNITIKYTAAAWELTASGTGISTTKYVDVTDNAENATTTKTIKLDTSSAGTKEIKLTGTVSDGTTGQTTKINTSVKVTVNPKTSSSGGSSTTSQPKKGTVSSCKINGVTVKESLTVTNKDSVPVVVKTSTGEGLTIYNSLTKKSYKVKSGEKANVQILEGTNTLTITLDSGAKATRKIYSQKEEVVKPNSIEEGQEEDVKVTLKTLKIDGFTLSPEFSPEVYEYTLTIPEDKSDITKLDIQADPSEKDYTVEIKGNEDLEAGENIITIIVKSKDGETVATYTIKVNKEQTAVQVASNVEETPQEVEEVKENETAKWIIVIFTALVAIAGIIFAVIEYQYGKTHGTDPKGEIPFANIGFETGKDTKSSILGNIKEDMIQTIDDEKINKKGKHF